MIRYWCSGDVTAEVSINTDSDGMDLNYILVSIDTVTGININHEAYR